MELKEFVSESLKQVIDGVIDAQTYAKSKGASINPKNMTHISQSSQGLMVLQERGTPNKPVQVIEYDVAITVTEAGDAKAGLGVFTGVFGVGAQSTISDGSVHANRIRFSVPMLFPDQG